MKTKKETITVVFDINYSFNTCVQKFKAEVKLSIPIVNRGELPVIMRNWDTEVFHKPLDTYWGNRKYQGECRYRVIELWGDTAPEIQNKVKQTINNAVNTLQKVIDMNKEKIIKIPTNRTIKKKLTV